jgi:hypothetical protein
MLAVLLTTNFASASYPGPDEGESYNYVYVEGRCLQARTRVWGAYYQGITNTYYIGMWEFHTWCDGIKPLVQAEGMVIEYWWGTGYDDYQFDVGTTYFTSWCQGTSVFVAGRTTQLWVLHGLWTDIYEDIDSGIAQVFVS